jgi:hypothetical protein
LSTCLDYINRSKSSSFVFVWFDTIGVRKWKQHKPATECRPAEPGIANHTNFSFKAV